MVIFYGCIQTGENEFILGGFNLSVNAHSTNPEKEICLKDAWEGDFLDGVWKPKALHNGIGVNFALAFLSLSAGVQSVARESFCTI